MIFMYEGIKETNILFKLNNIDFIYWLIKDNVQHSSILLLALYKTWQYFLAILNKLEQMNSNYHW